MTWIQISPQFLEAINGTFAILLLTIAGVFVRYIWIEFARVRRIGVSWRLAYDSRQAAIAMLTLLSGEGLLRGSVWAWRHFNVSNENVVLGDMLAIGVLIAICGCACVLRHFTPRTWSRWWGPHHWLVVPALAIIISAWLAID